MPTVIRKAKTSEDVWLEIIFDPTSQLPFMLDCSWSRTGTKRFIELPRMYRTERGARQAAALLSGQHLEWLETPPEQDSQALTTLTGERQMPVGANQDQQQLLEQIEKIESPAARRVLGKIAEDLYAGRLSGEDMNLLDSIAERIAERSESSLSKEELLLVRQFRRLNDRQRQGAMMLLSVVTNDSEISPVSTPRE